MTLIAAVRPDAWNLPLFVHVLGAMVLLGALVLSVTALAGGGGALRLAYRSLLVAALPAWLAMRVSAQWVAAEEDLEDSEAAWIGIGYITSELGLLLMIAATVCSAVALRRDRPAPGLTRAALVLCALLVVVYVFTIWAMTTKPD